MKWYHYLLCFLGGLFLANFFPHFINGVTGHSFPTPFGSPPGKGLSPPMVNVAWALGNLIVAGIMLHYGRYRTAGRPAHATAFLGFALGALGLAYGFGEMATTAPAPV